MFSCLVGKPIKSWAFYFTWSSWWHESEVWCSCCRQQNSKSWYRNPKNKGTHCCKLTQEYDSLSNVLTKFYCIGTILCRLRWQKKQWKEWQEWTLCSGQDQTWAYQWTTHQESQVLLVPVYHQIRVKVNREGLQNQFATNPKNMYETIGITSINHKIESSTLWFLKLLSCSSFIIYCANPQWC